MTQNNSFTPSNWLGSSLTPSWAAFKSSYKKEMASVSHKINSPQVVLSFFSQESFLLIMSSFFALQSSFTSISEQSSLFFVWKFPTKWTFWLLSCAFGAARHCKKVRIVKVFLVRTNAVRYFKTLLYYSINLIVNQHWYYRFAFGHLTEPWTNVQMIKTYVMLYAIAW